MNIPWRVLSTVVGADLQVYAALTTVARATVDDVAAKCCLSPTAAQQSLDRLCSLGFVLGSATALPEGSYIHFSVYRNPRRKIISSNSKIEERRIDRALARVEPMYTLRARETSTPRNRVDVIRVYESELIQNQFSPVGVLGCFYVLYKQHTSLDYRGSSFQEDLREAELLAYTASDVAIWCVRAFFSPHLSWVKNKSLTFLSRAANVHRFVLGVAMEMKSQDGTRPEWRGTSEACVLHRPNR